MAAAGWVGFFLWSWGMMFTIYVILQIVSLVTLRGLGRSLSLLPILPMAGVAAWTINAYRHGSNLWPILLILTSPLADLLLGILWFITRRKREASAG